MAHRYREVHPCLKYLPSLLASYIGGDKQHNGQKDLAEFHCNAPLAAHDGKFSVDKLNNILFSNLVECKSLNSGERHCHIRTFGSVTFESELCMGQSSLWGYPFPIKNHQFWGKNPQAVSMCDRHVSVVSMCDKHTCLYIWDIDRRVCGRIAL